MNISSSTVEITDPGLDDKKDHVIIDMPEDEKLKWETICKNIKEQADLFSAQIKEDQLTQMIEKLNDQLDLLTNCNTKVIASASKIKKYLNPNAIINIIISLSINLILKGLAGTGFGLSSFLQQSLAVTVSIYVVSFIPFIIPDISDTALKIIANIAARFSAYQTLLDEAIKMGHNFREILVTLQLVQTKCDKETQNLRITQIIQKCNALIDEQKKIMQKNHNKKTHVEIFTKEQCHKILGNIVSLVLPETSEKNVIDELKKSSRMLKNKIESIKKNKESTSKIETSLTENTPENIDTKNENIIEKSKKPEEIKPENPSLKEETISIEGLEEHPFRHYLAEGEDTEWGFESLLADQLLIQDDQSEDEKIEAEKVKKSFHDEVDAKINQLEKKFGISPNYLRFLSIGHITLPRTEDREEKTKGFVERANQCFKECLKKVY